MFRSDPAPVNPTITAVPGIQVGHAVVEGGGSGCTVVLGPFRGVHTPFDGDLTFCMSTAEGEESLSNPELLALGTAGRAVLEAAIEGAVR